MDIQSLLQAIPTIKTGIGLVCFALVIVVLVQRTKNKTDITAIERATPEQLPKVLDKLRDRWPIPPNLTAEAAERVLLEQIRGALRYKMVVAILLFAFGAYFLFLALQPPEPPPPGPDEEAEIPPIMPGEATLAYATAHLGTPRSTQECRQFGQFDPISDWQDGDASCATYFHQGMLIDVEYDQETDIIRSIAFSATDDEIAKFGDEAKEKFRDRVPSWAYPGDSEEAPPTFGEFFDALNGENCNAGAMGAVGSMILPWQNLVMCAYMFVPNKHPGFTAWRNSESWDSADESLGYPTINCYFRKSWEHVPDDLDRNNQQIREGCDPEHGYDPGYNEEELMDWIMPGVRPAKIDGYGRFFPKGGEFPFWFWSAPDALEVNLQ